MEALQVLQSENAGVGDKPKEKDMGTGSTVRSPGRKGLSDITNLPRPPKISNEFEKKQSLPLSVKEFIHQLQSENMALKKLLADQRLTEPSRIEIQRLQVNLEKLQLQNLQLAQANSQLLEDLNSGKDRLKAVHHELGCKNGLLQAFKFELQTLKRSKEGIPQPPPKEIDDKGGNKLGIVNLKLPLTGQCNVRKLEAKSKAVSEDGPPRRRSTRLKCDVLQPGGDVFEDEVHCTVIADPQNGSPEALNDGVRQVGAKKKFGNQDKCLRRRSTRFKCDVSPTVEDFVETHKDQESVSSANPVPAPEDISNKSVVKENVTEGNSLPTRSVESQKCSTGRPSRHAALKIQSYREIPLKVKMRRSKDGKQTYVGNY